VEIVTYPERLVARLNLKQAAAGKTIARNAQQRHAFFQRLVEQRGLRAQLRSGNLLTGQLYVALDYFSNAPRATIDWSRDPTELPVVPSTVTDLEAKLASIVAKLDKLPYEAIGADLEKALGAVDQLLKDADKAVNRIDADVTPKLKTILEDADKAVTHLDADVTPELKTTLDELRRTIATADRVLKNTDATLVGVDAPAQQDLRDALQEVTRAARSVRVLTDYLERHPEALIRGKNEEKP